MGYRPTLLNTKLVVLNIALLKLTVAAALPSWSQETIPVSVARAHSAPLIEEVVLTGSVTSPQSATLSTAVAGLVSRMYLDVGARVQAGTPLLELDAELAQIDLANAQAALNSAEASLAEAQRRFNEAKPLAEQNNIAATELRSRESQVRIAQAELEQARANANRQRAELARHTVKAPFAGVISRKLTEVGEWVAPGSEVMELVATDALHLDFQVPQNYFPRLDDQSSISVRFEAIPDRRYDARILSSVPVNNPSARTFLLRAALSNHDQRITPGMSAQGLLQLHTQQEGVLIPRDAIIRYADGRIVVWTVDQSSDQAVVREQVIKIGLSANGQVEVREGLAPGVLVVTRGNEALQPGQPVSITEAQRAQMRSE